jgi:hypothetical protein
MPTNTQSVVRVSPQSLEGLKTNLGFRKSVMRFTALEQHHSADLKMLALKRTKQLG